MITADRLGPYEIVALVGEGRLALSADGLTTTLPSHEAYPE
jgi:hypothetical protein